MSSSIYYNKCNTGLLITSNFDKYEERINLGILPNADYRNIELSEIDKYEIKKVAFDEIDKLSFQEIIKFLSKFSLEVVAIHNSDIDFSNLELDVKHLIIGDQTKISFGGKNFKHMEAITFLSVKSFKGKLLSKFENVKKLILWYENKKSNELLANFPSLKEFEIYNGSLLELDLSQNSSLEQLQLHRCLKLERIILNTKTQLKKVVVENCKKLDTSNLGEHVDRF